MFNSIFLIMGMGMQELLLILLIIIIFFGAKKIPELARGLGSGIREFKEASKEIKNEINEGMKDNNNNSTNNK